MGIIKKTGFILLRTVINKLERKVGKNQRKGDQYKLFANTTTQGEKIKLKQKAKDPKVEKLELFNIKNVNETNIERINALIISGLKEFG